MKPLNIVILVVAGAVGGAVIMKMAQKPAAVSAPQVAQEQAQPPSTPQPPAAAPAPAPVEPAPAAQPAPREAPKPRRVPRPARENSPAAVPAPAPAAAVPAAPAPAPAESPAPPPVPPAPEPERAATPPPAPEVHTATLNAGTLIPVRLLDGLSTDRNNPGDSFSATLDRELVVDGFVIAERGARVEGRVVSSDKGGRVKGVSGLAVEIVRLHTSDGQKVAIQTDSFEKHAESTKNKDAAKVGVGAAIGAAIGAIAGGGKGAAVGAGVGGGAGAGDVLLTRGAAVTLPSETRITFRLRSPVTITEKTK